MVGLLGCVTEVKRGQKGKYVRLQKSHKQFNEVHEDHEQHRENSSSDARCHVGTVVTDDEDQKGQRQNDDVSRANVRRQTNHQDRWLQQDSNDFHWHQNQLDWERNSRWPEDVSPIVAVARHRCNNEDKRGQGQGDPNSARHIECADERHQAQQIAEENEEERRQQERQVAVGLLFADAGNGHKGAEIVKV